MFRLRKIRKISYKTDINQTLTANGTVYGGIHTITLIPGTVSLISGDGIGQEMANSVKTIFKAANAPVEWEQFDLTGYTDAKDDTLLKQAMASIKKNKVALKGM
jgi:isocitrate dehydrogenase (NAD+)